MEAQRPLNYNDMVISAQKRQEYLQASTHAGGENDSRTTQSADRQRSNPYPRMDDSSSSDDNDESFAGGKGDAYLSMDDSSSDDDNDESLAGGKYDAMPSPMEFISSMYRDISSSAWKRSRPESPLVTRNKIPRVSDSLQMLSKEEKQFNTIASKLFDKYKRDLDPQDKFMREMLLDENPNFHNIDRINDTIYKSMLETRGNPHPYFRDRTKQLIWNFTVWCKNRDGSIIQQLIEWDAPDGIDLTEIDLRRNLLDDDPLVEITHRNIKKYEKHIEARKKIYEIFCEPEVYVAKGLSIQAVRLPYSIKTFMVRDQKFAESIKYMIMPRVNLVDFVSSNGYPPGVNLRYIYFPQEVSKKTEYGRSLPYNAFSRCCELEHLRLPLHMKIDNLRFDGRFQKKFQKLRFIRYPTPTTLEVYADVFRDLPSIEIVELTKGIQKIRMDAFIDCENLMHVEFPEGLKYIETQAFRRCPSLETAVLPSTLEIIDNDSFGHTTTVSLCRHSAFARTIPEVSLWTLEYRDCE